MSLRQPPRFAEWLLEFLGYARQNRALMGDLLEEFRNGRSAGWYWRQTLTVIGNGAVKNAVGPRSYCGAILIGFAVQALLILTQHRLHSWLLDLALWTVWVTASVAERWAKKRIAGSWWRGNFQRMIRTGATGLRGRPAILPLVSLGTFVDYYNLYLVYTIVYEYFGHVRLPQFAGFEVRWFGAWTLAPSLLPAPCAQDPDAVDYTDCFSGFRRTELGLGVALSDGATIVLTPENLAETAFATADEGLISALFGRGASLELVRRAIWLGGGRADLVFRRPGPISLSELASLVDEARRPPSGDAASDRVKHTRRKRLARVFRLRKRNCRP